MLYYLLLVEPDLYKPTSLTYFLTALGACEETVSTLVPAALSCGHSFDLHCLHHLVLHCISFQFYLGPPWMILWLSGLYLY